MKSEIVWMIIGMGLVTYIPRMLLFVLFKGMELPPFIQGVLKNVPYATLGALIFPAIIFLQKEDMWYGITGAAAAFGAAFLGANVIVVVLGSITVLALYTYFL
jgi:branched-subunit amino acid transport protein